MLSVREAYSEKPAAIKTKNAFLKKHFWKYLC